MAKYSVAYIVTIVVDAESEEHALEEAAEIDVNEWHWTLDEVCHEKDFKDI